MLVLAGMAEKQLRKHGGDPEKSLAAVAAGPSVRQQLAALGDSDLTSSVAFVGSHTPSGDAAATMSVGTSTSEGLRFRVLRPHAQGGLGAVFVALDGELNREVALKQILDRHADDPISRTRFLIEAEITGGLEHPGIVPVYGLGHYDDGRPYYAMRFIRGDSLKDAIAAYHADESLKKDPGRRSLALRKLLRRFVDVCNTIDYAHGRGVLHRDIKPSNVIVGKHGETLVVDWGLAKPMGSTEPSAVGDERVLLPSSASGSAETLPGSALGTPAYMSPEQAAGDLEHIGPRSDVYSLGATLYCLLTGHAPFEGSDLGVVLRDVQKGSFPPPRQVDPTIDRALEAVCLKAMAVKPEDRHATPHLLAEDIERYAADEPTSAWREPFSVKARRWMRRNRTAVTAASASVLMAVVGLVAVIVVESRANAELLRSYAMSEERFEMANRAVKQYIDIVNADKTLKGDTLKGLRVKLLTSASRFYDKLEVIASREKNASAMDAVARSYLDLANLAYDFGNLDDAQLFQQKAHKVRMKLVTADPANLDYQRNLAASDRSLANVQNRKDDLSNSAMNHYRESLSIVEKLVDGKPDDPSLLADLAASHSGIASIQLATGRPEEALASYRKALALSEKLAATGPTTDRTRIAIANTLLSIARTQSRLGQPAEGGRDEPPVPRILGVGEGRGAELYNEPRRHSDHAQQPRPLRTRTGPAGAGPRHSPPGPGDRREASGRLPIRRQLLGRPGDEPQ
jgi:serine/threonine protein kinase